MKPRVSQDTSSMQNLEIVLWRVFSVKLSLRSISPPTLRTFSVTPSSRVASVEKSLREIENLCILIKGSRLKHLRSESRMWIWGDSLKAHGSMDQIFLNNFIS